MRTHLAYTEITINSKVSVLETMVFLLVHDTACLLWICSVLPIRDQADMMSGLSSLGVFILEQRSVETGELAARGRTHSKPSPPPLGPVLLPVCRQKSSYVLGDLHGPGGLGVKRALGQGRALRHRC